MPATSPAPAMRAFNSRQARRQEAIRSLNDSRTRDSPSRLTSRSPSPTLSTLSDKRSSDGTDTTSVKRQDSASSNSTTRDATSNSFRRPRAAGDMTKAAALLGLADPLRRPSVVSIPQSTSTSSDRRDSFWSAGQRHSAASSTSTAPDQHLSTPSPASQPWPHEYNVRKTSNKIDPSTYRSPITPIAELEPTLPSSLSMLILAHPTQSPPPSRSTRQQLYTRDPARAVFEKEAMVPMTFLRQVELPAESGRLRSRSSAAAVQSTTTAAQSTTSAVGAMRRHESHDDIPIRSLSDLQTERLAQGGRLQSTDPSPSRHGTEEDPQSAASQPSRRTDSCPSPNPVGPRSSSRTSRTIMVEPSGSIEHYARPRDPLHESVLRSPPHVMPPENDERSTVQRSYVPVSNNHPQQHARHASNSSAGAQTVSSLQYAETPTIEQATYSPLLSGQTQPQVSPPPRSPARLQTPRSETRTPQMRRNLNFSKPFAATPPASPSRPPPPAPASGSASRSDVYREAGPQSTTRPTPASSRHGVRGLGFTPIPLPGEEEDDDEASDMSSTTTSTTDSDSGRDTDTRPNGCNSSRPGTPVMPSPTIALSPRNQPQAHMRLHDLQHRQQQPWQPLPRPVTYQPSGLLREDGPDNRPESLPRNSGIGTKTSRTSTVAPGASTDGLTFESTLAGPFDFSKTVL